MLSQFFFAQSSLFSSADYWILLTCALVFGFYMAWSIGANDVANAMGTSVGSKALTLKQAIVVAGVLEFVGAFLVGPHVSATIRKDIIPVEAFQEILQENGAPYYVYGMLAALLAAATWLLIATYFGLPVSTTHSIVGAVLGFGILVLGVEQDRLDVIRWKKVVEIVMSWVVSPLSSGLLAFVIFTVIQRTVLFQRDMVAAAKRVAPILVFLVFEVITLVTLWKGLKHLNLDLTDGQSLVLATVISTVLALGSIPLLRRVQVARRGGDNPATLHQNPIIGEELSKMKSRLLKLGKIAHGDTEAGLQRLQDEVDKIQAHAQTQTPTGVPREEFSPDMVATEKIFAYLQIISACAVAFAHGANDVANAVGPISGVIAVLHSEELKTAVTIETGWLLGILAIGGLGIVTGLATWGWRVIETIGKKITELTPTRGFAAEFGAAVTILVASRSGMPISTTHTLVGAVLGVGFARGIGALNLRVVRDIVVSWVVTLPAGAILAIVFFYVLRGIFG
jgi:PiT family inorganic phosphate transporter